MNNGKVFRSYRDKSKQLSSPYPNGNGFFSKVKSFFRNSSWSMRSSSPNINEEPSAKSEVKPFSYPEPDSSFRTPLKNVLKKEDGQTPNQVLSEFFNKKGNKPISEVEYEGVLSLIAKSNSVDNTPIKQLTTERSENLSLSKNHERIALEPNASKIITTPYQQKALKKGSKGSSAVFSTPEYRPVYHTVNDSFTSRNSVPSVKRVYQFSGLPSPYRTRIKAPSSVSRSKKSKHDISSSSLASSEPTPKKPLSQTANTLLSMLDEKNSDDDVNMGDDKIKRFSNPYADLQFKKPNNEDASNIKNTPSKRKGAHFTAKDINTTLAFNQTEELPPKKKLQKIESEKSEKIEQPTSTSQKINRDEKPNSPSFNLFKNSKNDTSISSSPKPIAVSLFNPPKDTEKNISNCTEASKPQSPSEKKINESTVPSQSTFNFRFSGSSKTEKKEDAKLQSLNKTVSAPFSFSETKPTSLSSNIPIKKSEEFLFPEVIPVHTTLNESKVQLYRSIFEF